MLPWQVIDEKIKKWMFIARDIIFDNFNSQLNIETKSGPNDLVTNLDKKIENYYINNIKHSFINSIILSEENNNKYLNDNKNNLLFIIDPIDGTMNFVKQKNNFASMIAVYQNNKPLIGYIMDVVEGNLYWGGPLMGSYCNYLPLSTPKNIYLNEGLIEISLPFLLNNKYNVRKIINKSCGVRIYGSAGIEFINIFKGSAVGYISHLQVWDFAAGLIISQGLNLYVNAIDGSNLNVLSSKDVLVSTKNAQFEINQLLMPN